MGPRHERDAELVDGMARAGAALAFAPAPSLVARSLAQEADERAVVARFSTR